MSTQVATIEVQSITKAVAERYGMTAANFEATLRATVVPKDCSKEQFAAFLLVAKEYGLNPIMKEIFAFPTRGGGIQPILSVDGWMRIMNNQSAMDGLEFEDHADDNGKLSAITCRIWRKDRSKPIVVTEYMNECLRDTDTWKKWPARMLRHKAAIQCARYAFGFSGIVDEDEYERGQGHYAGTDVGRETLTPPSAPVAAIAPPAPPAAEAPASKEKVPAKPRRKAGENRGPAPEEPKPEEPKQADKAEPKPDVEPAQPAKSGLPGDWQDYVDKMVDEIKGAKSASDENAAHETFAETVSGAVERGVLSRTDAELVRDGWDKAISGIPPRA